MQAKQTTAQNAVSMNASGDSNQTAATDSQETDSSDTAISAPVSLTLSVVGDCTIRTDENFDYDTSLNAYVFIAIS